MPIPNAYKYKQYIKILAGFISDVKIQIDALKPFLYFGEPTDHLDILDDYPPADPIIQNQLDSLYHDLFPLRCLKSRFRSRLACTEPFINLFIADDQQEARFQTASHYPSTDYYTSQPLHFIRNHS